MPDETEDVASRPGPRVNPAAVWVGLGAAALFGAAGFAFALLNAAPSPPPKEIAGDPQLVAGRAVFLDRCVSCHGPLGRGDGPIARGVAGPPPGNLTDAAWKHGDAPEQVRAVIEEGVKGTAMPGWGRTLGPDAVDAVAAYVYHLAGRKVPDALRAP